MRVPTILLAAVFVLLPACASAQRGRFTQRDSVLLARDLDGDSRIDYVVMQVRVPLDTDAFAHPTRVALYLAGAPRAGRPTWATPWTDGFEVEQSFGGATTLGRLSAVEIDDEGGDYNGTTVVLVENGRARKAIEHGVDYGNGVFRIAARDGAIVVDASIEHLAVNGAPVRVRARCPASAFPAAHLRYDPTRRRFVVLGAYCENVQ